MDDDDNIDLVFRYQAAGVDAGKTMVWYMTGTQIRSQQVIDPTETDLNWYIVAVGDIDGDGTADILFRNYATGDNKAWLTGPAQWATLPAEPDTTWQIQGIADYNSDGFNDIVWRRLCCYGENRIWLMNRTALVSSINLSSRLDLNWRIVGPR